MSDDKVPIDALNWINDYNTDPEATFKRMVD